MSIKRNRKVKGGKTYSQGDAFKDFIKKRDNYTCQKCGRPGRDIAHIIPYSVCGETRPDNVRLLCHSCNQLERENRGQKLLPYEQWIAKLEAELAAFTE